MLENVTTFRGRDRYTIETPWNYFPTDGDAMLLARVAETRASAELENVAWGSAWRELAQNGCAFRGIRRGARVVADFAAEQRSSMTAGFGSWCVHGQIFAKAKTFFSTG